MKKTLFFIGLAWPPTTFITRKLKALAESNSFNVLVGISSPEKKTNKQFKIQSIELVKLSHPEDPILMRASSLLTGAIKTFLKSPSLFLKISGLAYKKSRCVKHYLLLFTNYLIISSTQFDLAHFEWVTASFDYIELLELLKTPFTISARGSLFTIRPITDGDSYTNKLIKAVKKARKIHCVSKAMENTVKKLVPEAKTEVIYNGVDIALFNGNAELNNNFLRIIFIGNLNWKKSVDTAIFIFHNFLNLGGRGVLHIVGNGPEKERLYFSLKDLNLESHVVYHGYLKEKEVALLLKNMDILILTSLAEGLANVILEAMASYTVPVVTNVFGNPEVITHKKDGFLFAPLQINEPVKYLLTLYHNPVLLCEMKKKGREKIENMFTFSIMKKHHVKFFMESLS